MPIGKGKRRLQFILDEKDARKIEEGARRTEMSISRYLKEIFKGGRR